MLYPWFEHPLYLAARDSGKAWGFTDTAGGFREVTVYPKNVAEFLLTRQSTVDDWDFTQEHPILWPYENSGKITCHSVLILTQWMEISAQVKSRLTGYHREGNVAEYAMEQVYRWGHTASFSLGSFPHSLFTVLCPILDAQNIHYFVPCEPKPKPLPVLFLIDGAIILLRMISRWNCRSLSTSRNGLNRIRTNRSGKYPFHTRPNTRHALIPPKPKELESTASTRVFRPNGSGM